MLEEILKALQENTAALNANTAARNAAPGTAAPKEAEEDDDDMLGTADDKEDKVTQQDVIDAVTKAAGLNKPKTKEVLASFKVKRASDIPEADWAKAIVALGKVKK